MLEDFATLSLNEQAQYIWHNGTYIESRQDEQQKIVLYSVKDKFYEISYSNAKDEIKNVSEVTLETVVRYYYI